MKSPNLEILEEQKRIDERRSIIALRLAGMTLGAHVLAGASFGLAWLLGTWP